MNKFIRDKSQLNKKVLRQKLMKPVNRKTKYQIFLTKSITNILFKTEIKHFFHQDNSMNMHETKQRHSNRKDKWDEKNIRASFWVY